MSEHCLTEHWQVAILEIEGCLSAGRWNQGRRVTKKKKKKKKKERKKEKKKRLGRRNSA